MRAFLRGSLALAMAIAGAQALSTEALAAALDPCAPGIVSRARTDAQKALLQAQCPSLKPSEATQPFVDWFKAVLQEDLKKYEFPLTRGQWVAAEEAVTWGIRQGDAAGIDTKNWSDVVGNAFRESEIRQKERLARFLARVSGCTDGEDAQALGMVLGTMLEADPEEFLEGLVDEEKAFQRAKPKSDSCTDEMLREKSTVASSVATLAHFHWQKEPVPEELLQRLKRFRAKMPEIAAFFDIFLGE